MYAYSLHSRDTGEVHRPPPVRLLSALARRCPEHDLPWEMGMLDKERLRGENGAEQASLLLRWSPRPPSLHPLLPP